MLPILQMKNRKIPLIIYTFVNLVTILGLIVKNRFLNFTARIINGFTNVINIYIKLLNFLLKSFICIYLPLWVDQYGPRHSKSLMLAIQQVSGPLGVVLGYILTALSKKMGNVK